MQKKRNFVVRYHQRVIMPINRNTIVRYKTIDRMLRHGRQATLEELIFACSDALMENDKIGQVSRRTV